MNSKHYEGKLEHDEFRLNDEHGIMIASTCFAQMSGYTCVANAAELARRWNLHNELVEALEWMLADGTPAHKCGGHGGSSCSCICATEKAKAALQKAKGQQ